MRRNLGEAIPRSAPPESLWLIEAGAEASADVALTYAQMHAQADAVAKGLQKRGLARGTAVGILAGNSARYLVAFLGIMRAGLVSVPVNAKLPVDTIRHIEADARLALMLVDADSAAKAGSLPSLRIDDDEAWNSLLEHGDFQSTDMREDEHALVLYTSGSTGRPKGVPLTHGGYIWALERLLTSAPPMVEKRVLVAAPLFHMNALVTSLIAGNSSGTVVLMRHFSAPDYIRIAARLRCQVLTSVPTMLALVARQPEVIAQADLSHVEALFTGSAPSTESLFDRVAAVFPNARIANGYGTTEGGPVVFGAHPQGLPRPKLSLGYPVPEIEWKLTGGPDDSSGVFSMRSRAVMPGYLNMPELTARKLVDGWYSTGDVLRRDADGFFYFVGRDDDMFVCGGENIYPGDVEQMLEKHPAVAQVAIVPLADEIKGQLPVAFIVLRAGQTASSQDIKDYALAHAPAYQHPRFIEFVDALPLASTNKVDRKLLIERASHSFHRQSEIKGHIS